MQIRKFLTRCICGFCLCLTVVANPARSEDISVSYPGDVGHLAFRTVERRENTKLKLMLREGLSPHLRASDGTTLLMYAALHGDAEGVRVLLDAGANPNVANKDGVTALIWAASNVNKVRLLVEAGANVNVKLDSGTTALTAAASSARSAESVAYLLSNGAEIGKRSPLESAARILDLPMIEVLLDHYDRHGLKDPEANRVFEHAVFSGRADIIHHLMNREGASKLDLSPQNLRLGLEFSLSYPNPGLARMFMDLGAKAPSLIPATYSDVEFDIEIRELLKRGTDIHARGFRDYNALDFARLRGHRKSEASLLEAGLTAGRALKEKDIPYRGIHLSDQNLNMVVTTSVRKGLDLLFQSSDVFLNSRARCTSCHHQDLPAIAASIAHSRGIDIDVLSLDRMNRRWLSGVGGLARDIYAKDFRTLDVITGFGYQLWGRSALSLPDDPVTKAVVWYLANRQMAEGNWTARPRAPRMPLQDGEHVTTALAVRALQSYPLAGREAEFVARIEQARIWLENTPAPTHTQRAFRLLGLAWANAEPKALQGGIDDLLETQQKDGGWSQLNNLESDAWATGIALLALNAAGTAATDETYRRGIEYLVNTQFDDGSWFVRSRSRPALQHFDSHFPFGRDQWISASGTAVACASLALALDPVDVPIFKLTSAGDHVENEKDKRESPDTSEKTLPNLGNVTQSFSEDIRPILMNSCVDCHDTESQLGDYTMTDRRSLLRGGASGVHAVIPGHGAESQMVRHVTDQVEDMEMPPLSKRETYPALTAEQIQTLVTWIDEGAQWPEGVTLGGE